MKVNFKFLIPSLFLSLFLFQGCGDDSDGDPEPESVLLVNDFVVSIDENPAGGQVLGTIDASTTTGSLSFAVTNEDPAGAIDVNATTGQLSVSDASLFVFASHSQLTSTVEVTNGTDTKTLSVTVNINDPGGPSFTIWTGTKITFTKTDSSDPNAEANQDRITDNVWITRGNDGGQIYNAVLESTFDKATSPVGTEWAVGTTTEIEDLNFSPFRDAVQPKAVVGVDLVMHLIEDDVYIDVKFTSWSQGKNGGFAYERSTE